jgi:hypothetical protein
MYRAIFRSFCDRTVYYKSKEDKMICLSYKLLKSSIPADLSFKLIGAAINIWPLKETWYYKLFQVIVWHVLVKFLL